MPRATKSPYFHNDGVTDGSDRGRVKRKTMASAEHADAAQSTKRPKSAGADKDVRAVIDKEAKLEASAALPFYSSDVNVNRELARKKIESHLTVLVKLVVGPNETVFQVPFDILRDASPFFRAAIGRIWAKRDENGQIVLSLPEDDPFPVGYFIKWAHGGRVGEGRLRLPDDASHATELLVDLYTYGQKVLSEGFKNAVMNKVRNYHAHARHLLVSIAAFERAFNSGLPDDCALQRYFVDVMIVGTRPPDLDEGLLKDAPKLLLKIAQGLLRDKVNGTSHRGVFLDRYSCVYHEHRDTPFCSLHWGP
ncbi:hypothetical protein CAC42_1602 [Sphaceloma murrayae]|uniref:BTB domain-containing protein n=1 Tax=Sphaceloma murrayae TaxID=2082308 RepID=A0A2K1R3A4_9PEZI|nr:hypothetical protein CAC42_1602 [Sphaceloma murrayae]